MAQRYGGKYSPDPDRPAEGPPSGRITRDPVGGRSNVLFVPAIVLVATSFNDGPVALTLALLGAGVWTLAAWLLREGLEAEAAFEARKVARRPALPRKILSSVLTGVGTALAVGAHLNDFGDVLSPLLYGVCAGALHSVAFGLDPLKSKGMEGVDTFQQDRVARVVDEAEAYLAAMSDAMARARDRGAADRLQAFQQDAQAKADYLALLEDLDQNFAARTRKSLLEDRGDLTVEIEVLRERLSREGLRLE